MNNEETVEKVNKIYGDINSETGTGSDKLNAVELVKYLEQKEKDCDIASLVKEQSVMLDEKPKVPVRRTLLDDLEDAEAEAEAEADAMLLKAKSVHEASKECVRRSIDSISSVGKETETETDSETDSEPAYSVAIKDLKCLKQREYREVGYKLDPSFHMNNFNMNRLKESIAMTEVENEKFKEQIQKREVPENVAQLTVPVKQTPIYTVHSVVNGVISEEKRSSCDIYDVAQKDIIVGEDLYEEFSQYLLLRNSGTDVPVGTPDGTVVPDGYIVAENYKPIFYESFENAAADPALSYNVHEILHHTVEVKNMDDSCQHCIDERVRMAEKEKRVAERDARWEQTLKEEGFDTTNTSNSNIFGIKSKVRDSIMKITRNINE